MKRIMIIAAISEDRVIGNQGSIPWYLPADLARFKQLTIGKTVIMGRKTWESLPENVRPLPGRFNIVVTRQKDYVVLGDAAVAGSLEEAILIAPEDRNIYVIGGGELYAQALPLAETIDLTIVKGKYEGDTYFPVFDMDEWFEVYSFEVIGTNRLDYTFLTYERKESVKGKVSFSSSCTVSRGIEINETPKS